MSEYRALLERRMERLAPPSFTHQDILHRLQRRRRNRRMGAGVLALALFAVVAVWFGSSLRDAGVRPADREVSPKSQFFADASQICADAQDRFNDHYIIPEPRSDWPLERRLRYYRTGLRIFGRMDVQLRALTPPPGLTDDFGAALDAFERHLEAVAAGIAAAEAGDRRGFRESIGDAFGPLAAEATNAFNQILGPLYCP